MDEKVLFFFQSNPPAIPLYERFEALVLARFPDTEIRAQKTQISFYDRRMFACVSFAKVRRAKNRPKHYITVTFGLGRREPSTRIDVATEPYPGRWTHHVTVSGPEELDDELMTWISEAHAFAAAK